MGRDTKVIVIANQKGGVGKTTTSVHLAAGLAERGRKCLIMDLDASAGATKTLGAPTIGWPTIFDVIAGSVEPMESVITDGDQEVKLPKNVNLIPASSNLYQLDSHLNQTDNLHVVPQDVLLEPIAAFRGVFDYILLDSPPLVTKLTYPAYKCSDFAVFTTQLEDLSVQALADAMKLVASVRKLGHRNLALLGVLVTMMPRPITKLARKFIKDIDETVVDENNHSIRFDVSIFRNVAIQEAGTMKQTLFEYEPTHEGVKQFRQFTEEVENRIKNLEQRQENARVGVAVNG